MPQSRQGTRLQAPELPAPARRASRPGPLHEVRTQASRARPHPVCGMRSETTCGRPREVRAGKGRGAPPGRCRRGGPPQERPRPGEAALPREARRRGLHEVWDPPSRRRAQPMRVMPRSPKRVGTTDVGRASRPGPLRGVRGAGARRRRTVRSLCGPPAGTPVARRLRAQAVFQAKGAGPLHGLRRAFRRRVALPRVRTTQLRALARAPRLARGALELPGRGRRDRRGPGMLADRRRAAGVPGLLPALPGGRRGVLRRARHERHRELDVGLRGGGGAGIDSETPERAANGRWREA